ncbi:hypothetical protein N0V82_010316 [Gnomoniopsis sp. IMI 355080]|nr:hypothetical protein N0V82_010316 [Gnomoniopsis sp. IMI 355080]
MLLIVALLSMLGTSWAQVDPQGPQIKLQAVFLNGDTAYVENALANEFTTTDDVNAAAIFTADEASGYLFQASTDTINFPSGYAVPAIRTLGLVGVPELTGYDAETVLLGTDYYPLDCSGNLNLLGITELDVPLVCLNTGLTNIVTGFGLCPDQGNTIVNFGVVGTLEFPLDCGLDATVM